jgi:hypothetical protein
MGWYYCAVVRFGIFIRHQLIKLVPWSVCVHRFIFFFGFQIVSCSRMKGQRIPIFKLYLQFGKYTQATGLDKWSVEGVKRQNYRT